MSNTRKTQIEFPEELYLAAKAKAAREKRTLSSVVSEGLSLFDLRRVAPPEDAALVHSAKEGKEGAARHARERQPTLDHCAERSIADGREESA